MQQRQRIDCSCGNNMPICENCKETAVIMTRGTKPDLMDIDVHWARNDTKDPDYLYFCCFECLLEFDDR